MAKVKIGFAGTGGMGQMAHLRNYAVNEDCEVVALAEIRPGIREKVAKRYGIANTYETIEEMVEQEDLDGIVASQPFTRHGILVPQILKKKIPIFTEKPLAGSIEVGESILTALKESGTWHMVGYHKRNDPASKWALEKVNEFRQSGKLGKLKYIRAVMPTGDWIANGFREMINTGEAMPDGISEVDPPATDMDSKLYEEYIAFVNFYIHQVNLLRFFLGENYMPTFADKAGLLMVGESESGISVNLEMNTYATTRDWAEEFMICFDRGYVKLTLPAPVAMNRPGKVEVLEDEGPDKTPIRYSPDLPWDHAMLGQCQNFVNAIAGKEKPACEAAEALEDLKVAREYTRLYRGK